MNNHTAITLDRIVPGQRSILPLEAASTSTQMIFQPNDTIFVPGQNRRTIYRVDDGAVRIYRLLANGRRHICSFEYDGDIFGFETGSNQAFFAEAISTTRLSALSPGDAVADMRPLLQSMQRTQRNVLVLGYRDPIERVAALLCDMERRQGGNGVVELSMPRVDIADHLCLSIETISRVFTCLRLKRFIRLRTPRTVEILRPSALRLLTD